MTKTISPLSSQAFVFGLEERWQNVEGCRLRYLYGGSGPPLLLIHGLLGYSFSWRFNLTALAQHATVYAPDMPGMGFSERCPKLDCSLRATAARMLCFMDTVGIGNADVLGTSHGGAVAMMLAALDRERRHVRRLILVDPVNPWSRYGRMLTRILGTAAGALAFRAIEPRLPRKFFVQRLYGDRKRIAPGTIEGYAAPLRIPGTTQQALAIVHCWHADLQELESALPSIADIPTLLIWGDRDRAVLPQSAPKLAAYFRNAKLVMLERVGHLPYEEVPDQFNRAVIEFLTRETDSAIPGRD